MAQVMESHASPTAHPAFCMLVTTRGQRRYREASAPHREFGAATTTTTPVGSYVVVLASSDGVARERELLAEPGSVLHELYAVVAANGLSPCFPSAVEDEVETWLASPGLADPELLDLEALPFVTIDAKYSDDLDQALCLTREGGWLTVFYAIADASYYVRPGSALFAEAMNRGASIYLPGVVVPMLPKALSEGLISLNPGVARRALVFVTRLNPDGTVHDTVVQRARVKSRAKLDFERVQAFYDAPHESELAHTPFATSLELLQEFAKLRAALANEQDVVRYRRTEVETHLSDHRVRRFVVTRAIRTPAETYNEQLSLLCNAEGARLLHEASKEPLVSPSRTPKEPDVEAIETFRQLTRRLSELYALDERWVWSSGQPLARYLALLPTEPHALAEAIQRQALLLNLGWLARPKTNKNAELASQIYGRFSAPMREIIGVFLHLELCRVTRAKVEVNEANSAVHASSPEHRVIETSDATLRDTLIARTDHARYIQKRVTNASNLLVLNQVFGAHLSPVPNGDAPSPLWACVVGLTSTKIHVVLEEPPIDAKIQLADLRKQWHQSTKVSRDGCELYVKGKPKFRLGDRLRLVVLGHDAARAHWQLGIAEIG